MSDRSFGQDIEEDAVHGNSFRAQISVPLPLAQRILAALEDDATRTSARRALADELLRVAPELRAVMPK